MSMLACVTLYLFIKEANEQIKKDWNIRFVVLLLYPPFFVMTTGSSICFLGEYLQGRRVSVKATCFSGFCFADIDDMMGSDLRYNYEEPSELEVACFEVKKLVAGRKVIVLGAE